jgi:hypothetical protein
LPVRKVFEAKNLQRLMMDKASAAFKTNSAALIGYE